MFKNNWNFLRSFKCRNERFYINFAARHQRNHFEDFFFFIFYSFFADSFSGEWIAFSDDDGSENKIQNDVFEPSETNSNLKKSSESNSLKEVTLYFIFVW